MAPAETMREFASLDELQACVGEEVGVSDWLTIDQRRIDLFAEATGDQQWIHVDPAQAARGPYGMTIAHGLLTLSLIPLLSRQAMTIHNTRISVNYGLNKVRFTAPVPVGSRVRGRFTLKSSTALPDGGGKAGFQLVWEVTIEREGSDKPVCIAETISRRFP